MTHVLKTPQGAAPPAIGNLTNGAGAAWLEWQCRSLGEVERAILFARKTESHATLEPVAEWAASMPVDQHRSGLGTSQWKAIAGAALSAGQSVHARRDASGADVVPSEMMAVPIKDQRRASGHVSHVLVLAFCATTTSITDASREALQRLVLWGSWWLFRDAAAPAALSSDEWLPVGIKLAKQLSLPRAARTLADEWQRVFVCDRVSVGWVRGDAVEVIAISGTNVFDARAPLVRAIGDSMRESALLRAVTAAPSTVPVLAVATAQLLVERNGGMVCTVPLLVDAECVGAVTFERAGDASLSEADRQRAEQWATLAAPLLRLNRIAGQSLWLALRHRVTEQVSCLPMLLRRRSVYLTGAAILCLLASMLFEGTYRVPATATIEGSDRQVLVAPYTGYIRSTNARAGDVVESGDVIASLDDRELRVERDRWVSELNKLEQAYSQALATRDRTQVTLLQAKRAELSAELALIDSQLERGRLTAPYSGVLVSGDLSERLGARVEAGELLFEIASLDHYRLMLEVDEHEIGPVQPGQRATVRFSAIPERSHSTVVRSILPAAVSRDGRTLFRVEAELSDTVERLRPGMNGIARIETGTRSWLSLLTHSTWTRLRIGLWSLGW